MPSATRDHRSSRRPALKLWLYVGMIAGACWLRWDALFSGFFADDYAQLGMLDGSYPLRRSVWNLFTFSDGSALEGHALMDAGFYPWWADPTVRISMFRPLASLMTALDFQLFGDWALGYHLHSLLWWLLLLATVARLFCLWLPPRVAVASFAMLACANAHGMTLAWICNRSAILSTLLALIALHLHVSGREAPSRVRRWLAPAIFAVSLGFGEYALCVGAYVLTYECMRGPGPPRRRARALLPFAIEALAYLGLRAALGLSMQRSGLYVDAITEPRAFLSAVTVRAPVLIGDLLFALRSEHWTFGAPFLDPLRTSHILSNDALRDPEVWRAVQLAIGLVACVVVAWMYRVLQRRKADNVRWLALGAALSLVPVCGSFPSSRLTLAACVGFMPLFASFAVSCFARARAAPLTGALGCAVMAFELFVPAAQQLREAALFQQTTHDIKNTLVNLPVDEERFGAQDAVILASSDGSISAYLSLTRHRYGRTPPRACWTLSQVPVGFTLVRTRANAFSVRFHGAQTTLATLAEQLLRDPSRSFQLGEVVRAGAMRITIKTQLDDRPKAIEVQLDRNLDDPSLVFLYPTAEGYRRVRMPALGDSIVVPPPGAGSLPDALIARD